MHAFTRSNNANVPYTHTHTYGQCQCNDTLLRYSSFCVSFDSFCQSLYVSSVGRSIHSYTISVYLCIYFYLFCFLYGKYRKIYKQNNNQCQVARIYSHLRILIYRNYHKKIWNNKEGLRGNIPFHINMPYILANDGVPKRNPPLFLLI